MKRGELLLPIALLIMAIVFNINSKNTLPTDGKYTQSGGVLLC